MGKSLRAKKMKRKRTDKRDKLDNWETKNIEVLYEKMKEIIDAPAPVPTVPVQIKEETEDQEGVILLETPKEKKTRRSRVKVVVELESSIGKEARQRKERVAKKKAKKAAKGLNAEKMDVEQEKKVQTIQE